MILIRSYDFKLEKTVDETHFNEETESFSGEKARRRSIEVDVTNIDRAFGTQLWMLRSQERYGDTLDADTYTVKCNGAGGQSFGAFIPKGLTLELVGDSNDYFGKGLIRRKTDRLSAEPV